MTSYINIYIYTSNLSNLQVPTTCCVFQKHAMSETCGIRVLGLLGFFMSIPWVLQFGAPPGDLRLGSPSRCQDRRRERGQRGLRGTCHVGLRLPAEAPTRRGERLRGSGGAGDDLKRHAGLAGPGGGLGAG